MRLDETRYYLKIAKDVSERSPCSRRKFGAVIVKNGGIIATGYNGTIRGAINCGEDVPCLKDLYEEESEKSYEYCPAVHAEENAVIFAGKRDATGAVMYLSASYGTAGRPCFKCRRKIWQAGIEKVIYLSGDNEIRIDLTEDYVRMENEWIMGLYEAKVSPEEIVRNHLNKEIGDENE